MPELADNKVFLLTSILVIYWAGTLANLRGIRTSTWISGIGVAATLIVSGLVIALGIVWMLQGQPVALEISLQAFVPDFSNLHTLVFLAGILVITSGIEVSAVHAGDVRSPGRTFPVAILLSCIVSFCALLLGGLAIAIVVPVEKLSLTAGLMDAFAAFFHAYHISWLIPAVAGLVVLGSIGEVSAWIIGPSRGLLVTARDGVLPPFFQKINRHKAPVNILLIQAFAVTGLVLLFLFMPTVNSVYWILTVLTAQLYLVMYFFLFLAGIVLRYRQPMTPRAFRVPGGLFGMWCLGLMGIAGCLFTFSLGFIPPANVDSGNLLFFESFLGIGVIAMITLPLVLYQIRKPHWQKGFPEGHETVGD
jgi:amino acid transporter